MEATKGRLTSTASDIYFSEKTVEVSSNHHYPLSIIMIIMNIVDTVNFSHFSGYDL